MEGLPRPDPFVLDAGIELEGALSHRRVAERDGVGEGIGGETELEPHRPAAGSPLHRHLAAPHAAAQALRPGPEHRRQAPLGGQATHQIAAGRRHHQPQGAIEVRLAGPVGAGDQGQPAHRQHQLLQGAVAGHRQQRHAALDPLASSATPRPVRHYAPTTAQPNSGTAPEQGTDGIESQHRPTPRLPWISSSSAPPTGAPWRSAPGPASVTTPPAAAAAARGAPPMGRAGGRCRLRPRGSPSPRSMAAAVASWGCRCRRVWRS